MLSDCEFPTRTVLTDENDAIIVANQAVFPPAGARALPIENPKTSQEILTKAADTRLSWRKMTLFN